MEKQVNKLHLVYGYIICGIIILAIVVVWILSCEGMISRTAFDNFAFASSIVSIVLAVVSIVHSISSSSGVINSVKVLEEAEENIRTQVENLKDVEDDIISKVEKGNREIADQLFDYKKHVDSALLQSNEGERTDVEKSSAKADVYNLEINSAVGNVFLYICLKSIETGKSWRLDMLEGEKYVYYMWGYAFALKSLPASGFSCHMQNRVVSECEFSDKVKKQLTYDKIREALRNGKAKTDSEEWLRIVDAYFDEK